MLGAAAEAFRGVGLSNRDVYRGKGFYSLIVVYKEKSLTMGI